MTRTKKTTDATRLMDRLIPDTPAVNQELLKDVDAIRDSTYQLLSSVAHFGPIIASDEVRQSEQVDDITRLAKGIIADTQILQKKLDAADRRFDQLKAQATQTTDASILIPEAIETHQQYQSVIEQWELTVKPVTIDLTELLDNIK